MLDEPNVIQGLQCYWRSSFLDEILDDLIDAIVDQAARFTSPLSALLFVYMHGAATRVPPAANTWARGAWDAFSRTSMMAFPNINHLDGDERPEQVGASYGSNLQRLRTIKETFDPANTFRMNPNIT